jgi:hypothetical protein
MNDKKNISTVYYKSHFAKILNELLRGEQDDYYYHCTLTKYVKKIQLRGLAVKNRKTVSNYRNYSQGKIFLCDKGSVEWWKEKIEQHAFHNFDDESYHDVSVLRIKKSNLTDVKIDKVGAEDSKGYSYYVEYDIPPNIIEITDL